jgi:dienelactone hydrolase
MEQETLRNEIIKHLGQFPTRVPLTMKIEQINEEEDYNRTQLSYMVEPGERITAWLLSPKGPAPAKGWPGILAIHQHAGQYDQGKSEPAGLTGKDMHHLGPDLSRRGYVVLCPDQLCFGDRRPPEDVQQDHNGMLVKKGYEQFEFTRRILQGSCLQTKYLHDLTCALDLLTSLPEVNAQRLGAIGHSLGGQETLWLTWYDPRVTVGVSSCGFGSIPTILRDGINHNLALYVPGLLQVCDLDALLAGIAPRPFLLISGEEDPIFPIDGVRTIVAKAQEAYTQQGVPERFRPIIFPGKHSFPDELKSEAYTFLDRWLKE